MAAKKKEEKKVTKLTNLHVNEISLCRRGMNQEANIVLFKSADTVDVSTIAKSEFLNVLRAMKTSDEVYEAMEPLWNFNSALRTSVENVLKDDSITDKRAAIKAIIVDYMKVLANMFSPIVGDISAEKSCKDIEKSTEVIMPEDVKKQQEETLELNGKTIQKSVVGPEAFEILKAQAEQTNQLREALAKTQEILTVEKEKRELSECVVKAETLFPNVPVDSLKKGTLLYEVQKHLTKDSQDVFLEILKSANSLVSEVTKEKGTAENKDNKGESSNLVKYDNLAKSYAELHKISLSDAYVEVMKTDEGKSLLKK